MLSFPHARSAPGPQGSRTYNRYIDEESFLATAAEHTVDAWLGQVQGLLMIQESWRYERPSPVFELPTAEFCR